MLSLGLDEDLSWRRREPVQERAITLADFPQLMLNAPIASGVTVTEASALNFSAYYNGVDIISGQIAALPRIPYERKRSGARERVEGTPLARVMDQPNPAMTDFVFWQTMGAHMLTWGNAYAEIEFDRALRPIALWPVTPDKITPAVVDNRVVYKYTGRDRPIPAEDILHIPGMGFDGLKGYSVVSMARQSIGLGVAAERFGGALFGNMAKPGVVIEHPKTLTPTTAARLREGWDRAYGGGPDRAHGTAVLEDGMTARILTIPPDDAQFLQTREFQVVEIARWLNLPPHKLKHKVGERPGGNLESSQIEFLTDTLRPWLVRIEQEICRKLIVSAQRSTYYVEHLVDSILRMDGAARANSYKVYFDMGVLDAEQIAEKENLPKPKPKPEPVAAPADPAAPPAEPKPLQMNSKTFAADRANLVDAASRFVRREAAAARRAAKKGSAAFTTWSEEFYRDEVGVLRGFLMPAVRLSLACRGLDADVAEVCNRLAVAYVTRSKEELLDLPMKDLDAKADSLTARWEMSRAAELAEEILALQPEEMRAKATPATVNVTVNVPEQVPPTVNVEAHNHVAPTPVEVRAGDTIVNVPPQMAPDINVNVPASRPPDVNVTVKVPQAGGLKVVRDGNGNIQGVEPQ
jgi:HK97 family phage portal protein